MLTIEEIKSVAEKVGKKHGVERIYLFGSYARGDATENSDVDLRIDRGKLLGLLDIAGFYLDMKDGLNTEVDVLTTDGLKPKFLDTIKNDEIILYAA